MPAGTSIVNAGDVGTVGTLNFAGGMTFTTSSQLQFELNSDAGTIDLLNVTGNLVLGSGLASLTGTDLGSATLAIGTVLKLAQVEIDQGIGGRGRREAVRELSLVHGDARVGDWEQVGSLARPMGDEGGLHVGRDGAGGGRRLDALPESDRDGADDEDAGDEGHGSERSG